MLNLSVASVLGALVAYSVWVVLVLLDSSYRLVLLALGASVALLLVSVGAGLVHISSSLKP